MKKDILCKDLNMELEHRRQNQSLIVKNKLLSLELGPIASVSLEQMRKDAARKVKDQQLKIPLKTSSWFTKLEKCFGGQPNALPYLKKISRFQRYPVTGMCDVSKIISRKDLHQNRICFIKALDKLCLIFASSPAFEVLSETYKSAFDFIIREILGFQEEIYESWIQKRKLRGYQE